MGSYAGDADASYELEYVGLGKETGTLTRGRPKAQPLTVATVTSASPAATAALIPVRVPPRMPLRMRCFILPIPRENSELITLQLTRARHPSKRG
ncbi:hypothetical protein Sgleb_42740 [Streptomyces glebosus]|uniref:Uncharacterized protein n=1 Tax=Streptomyces glebosus TaxID=249580 RepID=A0A640SXT2_9ACTN|nr:hypothetical protein Sgleb_42740 [Streptomyces glebosus]GHG63674.1 hypothetical protein GCM10010513_31100 [Streptomyces glebosus]